MCCDYTTALVAVGHRLVDKKVYNKVYNKVLSWHFQRRHQWIALHPSAIGCNVAVKRLI